MSEHDETESACGFEIPSTGLRELFADKLCNQFLWNAPHHQTKNNWDEFDRKPQIHPIAQDELTALRNAVEWLACEVSGHSEKCTCGSGCAIAAASSFMPLGPGRDKCQRTKERFDLAMKAQPTKAK